MRRAGDPVGVVEQHAHVADAADARVRAGRRLAGLQAREAQDALLRLAGGPVVVDLLVGAGGHAHAPGPALVLVDQHHAVLGALVDGARRAGRHARRVEAVVADARQVVEHDPLQLGHLLADVLRQVGHVRVVLGVDVRAAQVVVPVRAGLDVDRLAGDLGDGDGGRLVVAGRRVEQILVAEGERLVVVFQRRAARGCRTASSGRRASSAGAGAGLAVLQLPAAAVVLLVFPLGRIAGAGPGLDIVPPHVLGALAVGPQVLAGDRAGVAADAFVQVEEHAHMSANVHGPPRSSLKFGAFDAAHEDKGVAVDAGRAPIIEGIGELGVPARHQHRLEPGAGQRVVHAGPLAAQRRLGNADRALGGVVDEDSPGRDAGGDDGPLDEHAVVVEAPRPSRCRRCPVRPRPCRSARPDSRRARGSSCGRFRSRSSGCSTCRAG